MTIYTKGGDGGETGLPGSRRLAKNSPIFDFLGKLDSANATLGVALSFMDGQIDEPLIDQLQDIQAIFLGIGALAASANSSQFELANQLPIHTVGLEQQIDSWDAQLPALTNFILPGGTQAGAILHQVRTAVRDAERSYHSLPSEDKIAQISIYLNRLADYFFQAARYYNFVHKSPETRWIN